MERKHDIAEEEQIYHAHSNISNNLGNPVKPARNSSCPSESGCEQTDVREVLANGLPNDINLYRQDVVRHIKHEGSLGVVMEVAGDLDSEGSITDDSDIDDNADENNVYDGVDADDANKNGEMYDGEKNETLPDGQVRILWTDGSESTDNIKDVTVVDRGFLHGDIVASIADPTGQLGLVVDVSIRVDLQNSNGEIIQNISTKDLKRIREFTIGDYVVLGPWLGRVDDVLDNVTVLFDDGSVCKVVKADPLRLKAVSRPVIDDANSPYYPGQRVRAVSSSVFKTSRWLSGLWKANRLEGTVTKVQSASVIVYWMTSAYLGVGTTSDDVPSEEQNPKDLTLLSCFSYANWQLGDWCLLQASVANKTLESLNLQETMEGCETTCPRECLVDDSLDYDSTPNTRSTEQVLALPNILKDNDPSETEITLLAAVDFKNNEDSHNNDAKDHLVAEQLIDGYTQNSWTSKVGSNLKLQDSDSMNQDKMSGESILTESIDVMPECGSCSISSSISKEPAHDGWPAYRKKLRKVLFKRDRKACRKNETFERALFIVNTVTKVDVAWQDGTREYGLESTSFIPIRAPSDQEFFPEQYVVEKASNEADDLAENNRVGIVKSVNSKERTVCVRWFKPVSSPEDPREFSCYEVVSAYELDEHPDYDYCYGDVVVRLSPASTTDSYLEIPSKNLGEQADVAESEADVSKKHIECDSEYSKGEAWAKFRSLSWVGNITGLQDGDIEVSWADGMVSKVGPQAVYVVGREDDEDSFEGGSDISDDGASWETVNENEMDDDAEKEADSQSANNIPACENLQDIPEEDTVPGKTGALSVSLAAINFVTRLATGLFSRNRRHSDLSNSDHNDLGGLEAQDSPVVTVNGTTTDTDLEASENQSQVETTGDAERVAAVMTESSTSDSASPGAHSQGGTESFKHFDISDTPSDNYFLSNIGQGSGERKWVKKIQQEWSILEKNLPDAIYVRAYEDRMDLLRAVIVGASGTPYQDGLFFFDFHLPPEYPQVPPQAYYHSGGLRVNPNLYVDGKVCLSLLNTWTGRGNEVWDSSSSSILQVLVSLQGLVLNSKPYFNEAGYEKQVGTIEGEKNSIPYNENAYLLNLKSMLYIMRRPPKHFEAFVKDHFQRRGYYILKACEAYMAGCLIGTLTKDACTTEKSKEQSSSVGFKLMLAKILPRLLASLTEIGVNCHQFEHLIMS
ncbi:probable ubiquitin-conjugating enzyme E2 23 [Dendrobium catenatum]|uniref:E2 ubiquitin-conjugating enzyme n=1 Tax=Dendrobium catenatum TaxID=906689 RepID=A0A2I0WIQ7_9ASPA|nr:probable ubiquitin-conjugating enzyme E2 23 [Dendrobium catenatum]XP_028552427.1 probable ubiquitin-conjugating enzyme E2 23 [Dendrobium catenatum]PKU75555.1 putative ubiquitin-conjugating enzyme E2 23 [Dendrobium catenatum]